MRPSGAGSGTTIFLHDIDISSNIYIYIYIVGREIIKTEQKKRKYMGKMKFEETELRLGLELGLPGGGCDQKEEENLCSEYNGNGKRNFAQTMDLKLNLAAATSDDDENGRDNISCHQNPNNFHKQCSNDPLIKPPAK